jgi:hypothetical protein
MSERVYCKDCRWCKRISIGHPIWRDAADYYCHAPSVIETMPTHPVSGEMVHTLAYGSECARRNAKFDCQDFERQPPFVPKSPGSHGSIPNNHPWWQFWKR